MVGINLNNKSLELISKIRNIVIKNTSTSVLLNNWKSFSSSEDPRGRAKPQKTDFNEIIRITIVKPKQMNGGIFLGVDSTLRDRRADGTRATAQAKWEELCGMMMKSSYTKTPSQGRRTEAFIRLKSCLWLACFWKSPLCLPFRRKPLEENQAIVSISSHSPRAASISAGRSLGHFEANHRCDGPPGKGRRNSSKTLLEMASRAYTMAEKSGKA